MESTELSERIRSARKSSGLSQKQLAAKLGLKSHQTISNWENGVSLPSAALLDAISGVLGIPRTVLRAQVADAPSGAGPIVDDARSFAELMTTQMSGGRDGHAVYVICQKSFVVAAPSLASAIAKVVWSGTPIVYVRAVVPECEVWTDNLHEAFHWFGDSLRDLARSENTEAVERNLRAASERLLLYTCEFTREQGHIKDLAMINPFLTRIYRCNRDRAEDELWSALGHDHDGIVWVKGEYELTQKVRGWIQFDLGFDHPYDPVREPKPAHAETLQELRSKGPR